MTSDIIKVINKEHAIERYSNRNRLLEDAVPYVGLPKQSASEPDKIILRQNPLSSNGALLEFKTDDVVFAENVETVSSKSGETFQVIKIWIRLGSIGIKLEPFYVQDYSNVLDTFFNVLPNKK